MANIWQISDPYDWVYSTTTRTIRLFMKSESGIIKFSNLSTLHAVGGQFCQSKFGRVKEPSGKNWRVYTQKAKEICILWIYSSYVGVIDVAPCLCGTIFRENTSRLSVASSPVRKRPSRLNARFKSREWCRWSLTKSAGFVYLYNIDPLLYRTELFWGRSALTHSFSTLCWNQ